MTLCRRRRSPFFKEAYQPVRQLQVNTFKDVSMYVNGEHLEKNPDWYVHALRRNSYLCYIR
jgi:hypothetical protein